MDILTMVSKGIDVATGGRQFVDNPTRQPIEASTRELIDKLLLERLSLAGIVLVTGVSMAPNLCESEIRECSQKFIRIAKKKGKLTLEMDELWSFVGSKRQK